MDPIIQSYETLLESITYTLSIIQYSKTSSSETTLKIMKLQEYINSIREDIEALKRDDFVNIFELDT